MSPEPKKPRQKNIPDKATLLREVEHWKWQAMVAAGQSQPWLKIPGLVVFLDTTDKDYEPRLEILAFAIKQLRR